MPGPSNTDALHTDRYELTMLEAARHSGIAEHRAVFEVFTRLLPEGRRFGVVAGTGRIIDAIDELHFDADELEWLTEVGAISRSTREWLTSRRFGGTITGYPEGELHFAGSPVLTVDATFGDAVLLETLVLSILNHDSAVAAAAARMRLAAGDRTLIDMGGRRTHEEAAVAAARAAWIAGFDATSNLEAGRRYEIPTAGTAAHAFVLAHGDEDAAFRAQLETLGISTTLLVDTYDIPSGIRRAVAAARAVGATGPGAIRIDSGDLAAEAHRARALLDDLGATTTRIVVSGDLDEQGIDGLERGDPTRAPVDSYGVGTRLVTGSGAPTAGFVFKLVAIADEPGPGAPLRPVAKLSAAKVSLGGRKTAWRALRGGRAVEEIVATEPCPDPGTTARPLQVDLLVAGTPLPHHLDDARRRCAAALAELPPEALGVEPGLPAIPTTVAGGTDTDPNRGAT